jgi:3-hydroxybutyryl-CoA dehydrogenase
MIVNKICVCGAGTMGAGIAQVAAHSGFKTILYEVNAVVLDKARMTIDKNLQMLVDKGKITGAEKENTLDRIIYTGDIQQCVAEVFIEAIIEKPEIKIDLFNQLSGINPENAIFASNTSSLSITELAKKITHPKRVIGMHFFNPAPFMKLVEVVNTSYTDLAATETIVKLAEKMGKTAVICRDSPGFIVNRVARPFYIEALRAVEEGKSNFADIDAIMEATGFKMGPFKLMDLIGNDINYTVSTSVFEQLHQPERLRPSYIQEEKVKKGELGKKTNKGYYEY